MQTSFLLPRPSSSKRYVGDSFATDEERRAHYLRLLNDNFKDPAFITLPGFPKGTPEAILERSDPPFFTLCPNPFMDLLLKNGNRERDENSYQREPFATDVSEGRGETIYNAHGYHTKVPHKAIMRYILHYTNPGDVVYDGFCGTGMTGVAAQFCGDKATVQSLGYRVQQDGTILDENGKITSKVGVRRCVLNDLSPAATFIAANYNTPVAAAQFDKQIKEVIEKMEDEIGWMFSTLHNPSRAQIERAIKLLTSKPSKASLANSRLPFGKIIYSVWSDVFICPECGGEVVFWDAAVVKDQGKILDRFNCPHCRTELTKRGMTRALDSWMDPLLQTPVRQAKQVPVSVTYEFGSRRFEKTADAFDRTFTVALRAAPVESVFPSERMPEGGEARRNDDAGITHVHHFFTDRNLRSMAWLLLNAKESTILWALTGISQRASKQHQIAITRVGGEKAGEGGATAGHRRGTLYIPSNQVEFSPIELLGERASVITKSLQQIEHFGRDTFISTGSASADLLPPNSVDYIFVDPPFGGNIMYSELNFMWEAFLCVFTNTEEEAIQNRTQHKGLLEYQQIMTECFRQFYRALKPGRWLTVEFHNSKNSVWNAIQEALEEVGFVVATVNTLNKQLQTHTQRTAAGSVDKDLAISAYKPNGGLEDRFKLEAGSEDGVWDFTRTHLKQLPVFQERGGSAVVIPERQHYLLFDRMVAFHVQRGVTVPISAAEFYAGLPQRFIERDGMFFLPDQSVEYDKKRASVETIEQLELIVSDETSAIQWLRRALEKKTYTIQELTPIFMQELAAWEKHEKGLELKELLEQNFLPYEGNGEVPSQIHSYLSSNFRDLRNLPKDHATLRAKAKDRWYVPDPRKFADLERIRDRALLKEFEIYRTGASRKLKVLRIEAVRCGFKRAWQERDYGTIIAVAKKIDERVLQEDPKLLMWYTNALTRAGTE